ncbi:MAG: peptidyl-prolyl cis-trans isomerase [Sphingomonadaceae bacterium]|nr:peptidyl-prolyl cis-trans isomerase [Sphingomonadaceae bacterium]
MIGRWLRSAGREPLVHFLIAGAALWVVMVYFGEGDTRDRKITLDEAKVANIANQWEQSWRRPPSPQELDGLIRDYIKEEIYFREAMRLGLDVDDPVIRRRLRSKMEFLATAQVENATPTDAEIERYFAANRQRYAEGMTFSFEQKYFADDEATARNAIAALNAGQPVPLVPTAIAAAMDGADVEQIKREFGDTFGKTLANLKTGRWAGPVRSGFGWHAVKVTKRSGAIAPTLGDVRQRVVNDWRTDTRISREAAAYQTLLDSYEIRIARP